MAGKVQDANIIKNSCVLSHFSHVSLCVTPQRAWQPILVFLPGESLLEPASNKEKLRHRERTS